MDELFRAKPRHLVGAALLLSLLTGCEGTGSKVKDPVVPPPPRRISMADSSSAPPQDDATALAAGEDSESGEVRPASSSDGAGDSGVARIAGPHPRGEVAAVVNGEPIFYDDVLVPATPQLKQAKAQLSPTEYKRFRRMVAEKFIEQYIEQELLLQALRRKLKPEQFDGLQSSLNKQVDEDLKKQMKSLGVSSIGELEVELRKSELSVEIMRHKIRSQKMAEQFLASKAMPRDGFDRPDLLAHYREHLEDYKVEARVRWQQIDLENSKHGGPQATEKLARDLVQKLRGGADFDALAREHSNGPTAKTGGIRDWTTQGSLAYAEVDSALFEMPIGGVSDPFQIKESFWIVKVLDRDEARYKPFEEMQDAIKEDLRRKQFSKSVKDLLAELRGSAVIWMFPEDKQQ
jgi:parvulin-like peptidyl-prolyl isomerase